MHAPPRHAREIREKERKREGEQLASLIDVEFMSRKRRVSCRARDYPRDKLRGMQRSQLLDR